MECAETQRVGRGNLGNEGRLAGAAAPDVFAPAHNRLDASLSSVSQDLAVVIDHLLCGRQAEAQPLLDQLGEAFSEFGGVAGTYQADQ